jgi:hypothetical protein
MVVYPLSMPYCGLFDCNVVATNKKGTTDEGRRRECVPLTANQW